MSNEEIEHIMKIIKSLEELGLLIIAVCETIKNESKVQVVEFLEMLLGTLSVIFWEIC